MSLAGCIAGKQRRKQRRKFNEKLCKIQFINNILLDCELHVSNRGMIIIDFTTIYFNIVPLLYIFDFTLLQYYIIKYIYIYNINMQQFMVNV